MTEGAPKFPRLQAAALAMVGAAGLVLAAALPVPHHAGPRFAGAQGIPPKTSIDSAQEAKIERYATALPTNRPPRYPDSLRARGIQGRVVAKFVVDTTGTIEARTFEVVMADHPAFVEAVRDNLAEMRFRPATVGSRPVRQLVQMPFTFSLAPGSGPPAASAPDAKSAPGMTSVGAAPPARPTQVEFVPRSDTVPSALPTNRPPAYPPHLIAAGIQGRVIASFTVLADGTADMSTFKVIKSDHDDFTAAVRTSLVAMRFNPAMRNGQPVAAVVREMPFQFSLVR